MSSDHEQIHQVVQDKLADEQPHEVRIEGGIDTLTDALRATGKTYEIRTTRPLAYRAD